MGDMFEVSSMRREDLATHRGTFRGDDVLQSRTEPSVAVERGHQVSSFLRIENVPLEKFQKNLVFFRVQQLLF